MAEGSATASQSSSSYTYWALTLASTCLRAFSGAFSQTLWCGVCPDLLTRKPRLRDCEILTCQGWAVRKVPYLVFISWPSDSKPWACVFSPGLCWLYDLNLHLTWNVKIVCGLHWTDYIPFWEVCFPVVLLLWLLTSAYFHVFWHVSKWDSFGCDSGSAYVSELTHLPCKYILEKEQIPSWAK